VLWEFYVYGVFIFNTMDVRRSVNCCYWTDEWIETLKTDQKLLFLYLLTNPLSNILGIYKISLNRIAFETGITIETVTKHLKVFESLKKVFYLFGHIIIVNHLKHQALNPNMMKNVMKDYKDLPNDLKDKINGNASESFETLSKSLQTLLTLEIESETIESEIEIESGRIEFENFWNIYNKKVGDKDKCFKKWSKLKQLEKDKIFETLPDFLKLITDKQFQPHPETYLNNKRWNDEIKTTQQQKDVLGNGESYVNGVRMCLTKVIPPGTRPRPSTLHKWSDTQNDWIYGN
jgi:hypothetical protein